MSACLFCGEYASNHIQVPHDYLTDLRELQTNDEIIVSLPTCTECREALDEVSFQSIEGAAGYLSSVYQERYQHLLSTAQWTPAELQEFGHSLRSSIEISSKSQFEIMARIEHCDRVHISGPCIPDDLYDDLIFKVSNNISEDRLTGVSNFHDPMPLDSESNRPAPEQHSSEVHLKAGAEGSSAEGKYNANTDEDAGRYVTPSSCAHEERQAIQPVIQSPDNDLVEIVLTACEGARAQKIAIYDSMNDPPPRTDEMIPTTSVMIVACGRTADHVGTIADNIIEALDDAGVSNVAVKGLQTCERVVLDIGPVVVNILRKWPKGYDVVSLWEAHEQDRSGLRRT